MFTLAAQVGKVLHRPHLPMLREHNVRTGFFEREEFEAVRDALPDPHRPVVTFAYFTGWRVASEVLSLQWRLIDRTAGIVRLDVGTTKNDAGRVFPYGDLLPELRDTVETQWLVHEWLQANGVPQVHGCSLGSVARTLVGGLGHSARYGCAPARPRAAPPGSRMTFGERPCETWCAPAFPSERRCN